MCPERKGKAVTGASGQSPNEQPIYLDFQATTPTDPHVVEAMLPYFTERFGNPHSRSHAIGGRAEEAVEQARARIAGVIGADPREIIFTSGATESNNLALKGVAHFYQDRKNHVVTCVTEHKCVLEAAGRLERDGFRVSYLGVRDDGLVDLDELADAITEDTVLVSIMAAHNEIGILQPIAEIGALCREHGVFFHTDAAQAVGKIPLDVAEMGIDLMSISGHKVYGPMGIGALYVRRRPRVRLAAQIDGGGQERGMRSGTLPTPLCIGLGQACALAAREMGSEAPRLRALRDRFLDRVRQRLPDVRTNGDMTRRLPGSLNLTFPGIDAEALMTALPGVAFSSGSACTSASLEPSYVLRALGVDEEAARASVRFGFGRTTTEEEVDRAVDQVVEGVERLRSGSRAWANASQIAG